MLIKTFVSTIWTLPEPSIFLVLDSLDEVLADFVGRSLGIAMLAQHNTP